MIEGLVFARTKQKYNIIKKKALLGFVWVNT